MVDAADSVEVTRAVADACAAAGVPFVWGTARGYDGQVSVFHDAAEEPVDFHDLHPEALPDEGSCAADGVLPALCGAVGAVMAAQVTALVAGLGEPLLGRVLTVDQLGATLSPFSRTNRRVRTLIDGLRDTLGEDTIVEVPRRGFRYEPPL